MSERALRRSILQSCTPVHSCRLSLAKPARLCDIAPYNVRWWCGAKAHAQQLALCKEPIANSVVFLARRSVLLPAPGTLHTSQRLSQNLSKFPKKSHSKRQPTSNALFLASYSVLLSAPGTLHTSQLVSKYPLPSVKIRTTAPTNFS